MDIAWNDASSNRIVAERLMRNAPGSDLYVLPEMFTTGFAVEPEGVAEKAEGDTLQWMRRMAATLDGAVAGSVSVKTEDGQYRNMFFTSRGPVRWVQKRLPWCRPSPCSPGALPWPMVMVKRGAAIPSTRSQRFWKPTVEGWGRAGSTLWAMASPV